MDLSTSLETITFNEQTNYRLMEIGKIKDYFDEEINDQQILVKKLSKCITGFDYRNCNFWEKHICSCQNKKNY